MKGHAIWKAPLLILAGVTALVGVAVGIVAWNHGLPEPWGPAVQWGLGGASLVFTTAQVIHSRQVGRRELELLVLGIAILVEQFFVFLVAGAVLLGLIGLLS